MQTGEQKGTKGTGFVVDLMKTYIFGENKVKEMFYRTHEYKNPGLI